MPRDLRIQKFMSDAGAASRRKAEEYVKQGRVKLNGRPVTIGDKVDPKKDIITLDGKQIIWGGKKYYIMLHKPRGFITTLNDEMDRKCVAELVKEIPARLYPIGRLDKDSEGLLLMTNDGAFANAISHPSGHMPKLYRVTVRPGVKEEQITAMAVGIVIDGVKTAPCTVRVLTEEKERSVLEIVLNEGRNRQIRKMCESLGLEVARLKRTAIGPVKLGMLQPGQCRELTAEEIRSLSAASAKAKERNAKNDRDTHNVRQAKTERDNKQQGTMHRGRKGSSNDRKRK